MLYSKEFKENALQLYKGGKSACKIARRLGCGTNTIYVWLRQSRIPIRQLRKYSPEDEANAVKMYQDGIPTQSITQQIGCCSERVYTWLRAHNLQVRPKHTLYILDSNYFEKIDNPDKAYWVGFLLADGCICRTAWAPHLSLEIQKRDKNHLLKFQTCLAATHPIQTCARGTVRIRIYNQKICDDLIRIGVTPRKTHTARPAKIHAQFRRDYFRGLVDGDGCITGSANPRRCYRIVLCGTKAIVTDFSNWLGYSGKYVYFRERSNCYCFEKQGHAVPDILHKLYHDAHIYLDRKYNLYREVANSYTPYLLPP